MGRGRPRRLPLIVRFSRAGSSPVSPALRRGTFILVSSSILLASPTQAMLEPLRCHSLCL